MSFLVKIFGICIALFENTTTETAGNMRGKSLSATIDKRQPEPTGKNLIFIV